MGAMSESKEQPKTAGVIVYLQEEIGNARMRCDQLLRYVDKATKLIERSSHKDHLFEVAGDVIQGLPVTSLKLHNALQSVALAANRIDYEEIKQDLRPEKVEELERVLKDVRVRQVQRRSQPMLNPGSVVDQLKDLAKKARTEGRLDTEGLGTLVASLEAGGPKVADDVGAKVAAQLEAMAHALEHPPEGEMPSRVRLAQVLRKTLAEHIDVKAEASEAQKSGWFKSPEEEVAYELSMAVSALKKVSHDLSNARRGRTMLMTALGCLGRATSAWGQDPGIAEAIQRASGILFRKWESSGGLDNEKVPSGMRMVDANEDEKLSRFEEGKSADPTKKMSPEDAKAWKENTDEYGDKFTKEAKGNLDMMLPPDMPAFSPVEAATGVEEAIFNLKHLHRMLTTNSNVQAGGINRTFKAVLGELGAVAWNMNLPMLHTLLSKAAIVVRVRTADADSEDDDGNDIKKEASIDAEPRDIAELEGVIDQMLTDARLVRSFARTGNYRKMFFNIMKVLADIYVTTQIFDIPGTGFIQRVIKALMPYAGARPSTNFAALDEDKSSRFEEGESADPTKKMSPEDAKEWKENTEEHKDKFKAAGDSSIWKVDASKKIPAPDDGSIVEEIMSWHGGQGTNLYSVGSTWNSGRSVDADDAEEAYSELERKRADRDVLEAFEGHLKEHGVKLARGTPPDPGFIRAFRRSVRDWARDDPSRIAAWTKLGWALADAKGEAEVWSQDGYRVMVIFHGPKQLASVFQWVSPDFSGPGWPAARQASRPGLDWKAA